MTFLLACGSAWLLAVALILCVDSNRLRRALTLLLPGLGVAAMFGYGPLLLPWQRLLASCLVLLYLLKAAVLLRRPRDYVLALDRLGLALYLSVWPGLDSTPFERRTSLELDDMRMVRGAVIAATGVGLGVVTALLAPVVDASTLGWMGIAAFLLCLHFGLADVLTFAMQALGFAVTPLFDQPWRSRSLRDFWSRRWNHAFVEMDMLLFWPILRRNLGVRGALLGVFVISGLLHEGGLSYPAWNGWGTPLLYFVLQGLLVSMEVRWRIEKKWPLWVARLWSTFWILAPLPLLFHASFRQGVVAPLFVALHGIIDRPLVWWFDLALHLAAIGHACILIASSQVPSRLNWHEDLQKLSPFNRKIMWTYGAVIVLLIISFGLLTWGLHAEMLRGDRAALAIALLIGGFWSVRIGVDLFYFKPSDWPKGPLFVVGHVLLTGLFIALTCTYLGLVIWHAVSRA